MKKLLFLLIISGLFFATSCKKDDAKPKPTAAFDYTGGGCTAPCAVLFENKSKNAVSYIWNFGDGTTSTEENPTKTYDVGGTYTVELYALSGDSNDGYVSKQILIQQSTQSQLPVANFTFSGGGCNAPCEVQFTNTSTNATSYQWDFGDGATANTQNASHTYTTGGAFSVILTATNNAGSTQTTKTINIGTPPTKVKITKITVIQMPFVDGNGASWDVGSGPDVYFTISDANNNIFLNESGSRINDVVAANLPIYWTFNTPFVLDDFNVDRFIDLLDYDTLDADDYIGYVGFKMSNYTSGGNAYPSSVTNTQNGITIKLDLTWQ